ncbi:MAG: right-handed parallel beta-helix repeat-containing protein [Myxococcaceae bacterium]
MTRALFITFGLFLADGCARSDGPAPALERVEPAFGSSAGSVPVVLVGSGFAAKVHAELDRPGGSTAEAGFGAWLEGGAAQFPLEQVVLVDARALSAVIPARLPAGRYDLKVMDPRGREAALAGAYEVLDGECPAIAGPHCLIAGECFAPAAADPANPCLVCDPAADAAGWSPVPEGAACDDADGCTGGEACHAGVCGQPSTLTSCVGECLTGVCDPATGACVPEANGLACDDANACTGGETCSGGLCGAPVQVTTCPPVVCASNLCAPSTGACLLTLLDAGSCTDHNICSSGDGCSAGVCGGVPSCGNTAPRACLSVNPNAGATGFVASLSATCSDDLETPGSLQARFDFEADGTFDTLFDGGLTATHAYPLDGIFEAVVEVQDPGGLSSFARRMLVVALPSDDVVVTTAADEGDPGATPSAPGSSGLSLREAIGFVNGGGVAKKIRFAGPMTITVASPLPLLNAPGMVIAGSPGVVLDFGASKGVACLVLNAPGVTLIGLEAGGCAGRLIDIRAADCRVAECTLGGTGRNVSGVLISAPSAVVGPRNEVAGFSGEGVSVRAASALVEGNRVRNNGTGVSIEQGGHGARVQLNQLVRNAAAGLYAHLGDPGPQVLHNTVVANGGSGIELSSPLGASTLQNNLLSGNAGYGLSRHASISVTEDHNLFFGNGQGAVSPGAPGDGGVLADPLFIGPAIDDYRLAPSSPAVNAGLDAGIDVNGPGPGRFEGTSPDLGSWESPY